MYKYLIAVIFFISPLFASAQTLPTFLPSTLGDQPIATTTLTISASTLLNNDLDTVSYDVQYIQTVNLFTTNTANWCYPTGGGGANFGTGNFTYNLVASNEQTSNNTGGSPDCDVSGTYYINFRTGTPGNYEYYYTKYYYDQPTNSYRALPTPDFIPTASVWARTVTPANGVITSNPISTTIQINKGTSTATSYKIIFASNIQQIPPITGTLASTSQIQTFSHTFLLPNQTDDSIFQRIFLFNASSSQVYLSPDTTWYFSSTNNPYQYDLGTTTTDFDLMLSACDTSSVLFAGVCSVVSKLFIPSSSSIQYALQGVQTSQTIYPFSLIFEAREALLSGITSSSTSEYELVYTFNASTTMGVISVEMLSIDTLTSLFGSSLPTFRMIMQVALFMAFISMIYFSFQSFITVRERQ